MVLSDLHVHTKYCDGKNSTEEMILAAIDKGMECIGFSGHGYTDFDESFCMSEQGAKDYIEELRLLRDEYSDSIEIRIGVEQDQFSNAGIEDYEYAIGSTHYVFVGDEWFSVDETSEVLKEACDRCFDGDFYALCEAYFEAEAEVIAKTGADIIGHFDLVSKFNEKNQFWDEKDPRYVNAWKKAADILIETGRPFEINTGAISRGYRTEPYPSLDMIEYIKSKGGSFILSSDSHRTDTLLYGFEEYQKYI